MQVKKLDEIVNQAKSKLELKRYVYPQENPQVKYTEVGELIGLLNQGGHFVSAPTDKTFGMEMVKRGFQDDHKNSEVLLDDDTSTSNLVKRAFQDEDNKAADFDEFNNGFTFEDYNYPSDTQPVLNNVTNYMPSTSLIVNNYDNISQINSLSSPVFSDALQHPFDPENFNHQDLIIPPSTSGQLLLPPSNNSCPLYYFEMSNNTCPIYEINGQFYT